MSLSRVCIIILFTSFFNGYISQTFINETIQFDGLTREYDIYIPTIYDGTSSVPLIFSFHGGNGNIAGQIAIGDLRPIADTANFIAVYPQARADPSDGNSLNWLPKTPGTFDDVPFINALIDAIAINYEIDEQRIYACGYSLGGEFSYELACKLNNRIAAIGAVARTMQANPNNYCNPIHPTGVLTVLGTDDITSPYNGLTYAGVEYYLSAAETHNYWITHNECNSTATMNTIGQNVERYSWSDSSSCIYVEELKVIGGGHDWPGSFGNMEINTTQEIWNFVSKFDTDGLINCTNTSAINDNSNEQNQKTYPNPFNDFLTVLLSTAEASEFTIYNTLGNVVRKGEFNSKINRLDLSNLPPNIYILRTNNKSILVSKAK
jgi:polyhydroxybutyrate depolymerase